MSDKGEAMKKSERTATPKLRFPQFEDEPAWDTSPGDELFEQINSRATQKGLPVLAVTQDQGAVPRDLIDYHVSVTDKSIESYKKVCPDDFIISLRSFQGGIEHSRYHGICSPAYIILRRRGEGSDQFYKHLFKSYVFIQDMIKHLEGLRDGKMVSYGQFSELYLPAPSPAEQKKVADCLNSIDDLIAAATRKLQALKRHKSGLTQRLFPLEGETLPRLRFPEFRNKEPWRERKAGDLFADRMEAGEKDLPVYSVTMNDGMVLRSSLDRSVDNIAKPEGNKKVHRNDLAYNMMRMWQGAFGVAPVDCMVSPAYVILSPREGISPHFFSYFLKSPNALRLLSSHSQGLTKDRLRLYYKDFATIDLPCPPLPEQERIAGFLASLDTIIVIQGQGIEALQDHKKSLMQQLFPSESGGD